MSAGKDKKGVKHLICNKTVVKNFYYKTSKKLSTRLKIWEKYGTNSVKFNDWILNSLLDKNVRYGKYVDVGCGTGKLMATASDFNIDEIFGVDLSPKMVEASRLNNSKISSNIFTADISKLPFPDNYFDLITAIHVFHHLSDISGAIIELKRVCKRGGVIFITTSDYQLNKGLNRLHYETQAELGFPKFMQDKKQHLHFNHKNALRDLKDFFENIEIFRYKNNLNFNKVKPAIDYYQSAMMYRNTEGPQDVRVRPEQWALLTKTVRKKVEDIINRQGFFLSPAIVYGYRIIND